MHINYANAYARPGIYCARVCVCIIVLVNVWCVSVIVVVVLLHLFGSCHRYIHHLFRVFICFELGMFRHYTDKCCSFSFSYSLMLWLFFLFRRYFHVRHTICFVRDQCVKHTNITVHKYQPNANKFCASP